MTEATPREPTPQTDALVIKVRGIHVIPGPVPKVREIIENVEGVRDLERQLAAAESRLKKLEGALKCAEPFIPDMPAWHEKGCLADQGKPCTCGNVSPREIKAGIRALLDSLSVMTLKEAR